jgi:hypothetical protein
MSSWGIGEAKKWLQNLVKGVNEAIFAQVIENAAKINMQTMSQSPVAICYSENIE